MTSQPIFISSNSSQTSTADTRDIATALKKLIDGDHAVFTCGGLIPLKPRKQRAGSAGEEHLRSAGPVSLYWQAPGSGSLGKVMFPLQGPSGQAQLDQLSADCQPASFGYQGQDVVDEDYRKATKLDRSQFAANFCPYETGIIDVITQMLLPEAPNTVKRHGVQAELYKLNIYASPSGFFKPHVDTPRAKNQFGSLVVSLPCHHEGGQLIVRHLGRETAYDWSSSKLGGDAIGWAAFYSDCEHEVKEVSHGHRVTLTYNLYVADGVGDLASRCPILDVTGLPLYISMKRALADEDFMPQGGILGIFCSHSYAHSSEQRALLPGNLKGIDMAVYAVLRTLGLYVALHAVLDDGEDIEQATAERASDPEFFKDHEPLTQPFSRTRPLDKIQFSLAGMWDDFSVTDILDHWQKEAKNITWISDVRRGPKEVGFVHMAYGNNADLAWKYTYAAMLVAVPPAEKRSMHVEDSQVEDLQRVTFESRYKH